MSPDERAARLPVADAAGWCEPATGTCRAEAPQDHDGEAAAPLSIFYLPTPYTED